MNRVRSISFLRSISEKTHRYTIIYIFIQAVFSFQYERLSDLCDSADSMIALFTKYSVVLHSFSLNNDIGFTSSTA